MSHTNSIPKPEREPLETGQEYWIPFIHGTCIVASHIWVDDSTDRRFLARGLIHLYRTDAEAHAKAMLSETAPHRALLLQIHEDLSHAAKADTDPANWKGYTLHRIERLLWPERNK